MFMPLSASERQTFPSDPERLSMRMVNSLVMGMPGTSLRAMNGRRDESPSCRMAMRLDVVGDGILRLGHGGCKGRSNGTLSRGRRTAEPWRDPSSMDESLRLGLGLPPCTVLNGVRAAVLNLCVARTYGRIGCILRLTGKANWSFGGRVSFTELQTLI